MARFKFDDDVLVADECGDLTYEDARRASVEEAVTKIEEAIWNLVDEIEYISEEEYDDPTVKDEDYPED